MTAIRNPIKTLPPHHRGRERLSCPKTGYFDRLRPVRLADVRGRMYAVTVCSSYMQYAASAVFGFAFVFKRPHRGRKQRSAATVERQLTASSPNSGQSQTSDNPANRGPATRCPHCSFVSGFGMAQISAQAVDAFVRF